MNDLTNLARIVTSRGGQTIPVIQLNNSQPSKENKLVGIAVANPNITTNQVIKEIYEQVNPANRVAMARLKSRVQTKLLNHLYFLDHSDPRGLVSRRFQLECLDLFHKATILFNEGEYDFTMRLARRCLAKAEIAEFTHYTVMASRMLVTLYAQLRQPAAYKKADEVLQKALQIQQVEEEAERLHVSTVLALASTVKSRQQVLLDLPNRLKKLEALHRRTPTFNTYYYLYRLRLAGEELQGNFGEIIRVTNAAARQFANGKLNQRRFDMRFNTFMNVFAHLRSRQPVKGLQLAQAGIRHFDPASSNWFFFQENHLLLALHAERYEYAQNLYREISLNEAFAKQRPAARERWELYKGYLDFVSPPARYGPKRRMQMIQWALTLPEFSKDKQGQNVAILVLQLLHFLREKNMDEVLIRLERLRKYQQRHLSKESAQRSRLFLRLLRLLVETDFSASQAEVRGRPLYQALARTAPPGEAGAEIEIIPYEQLWTIILNQLRTTKAALK